MNGQSLYHVWRCALTGVTVLLAGWPFVCGSAALRPRALRPQLKRDPLGGALSPPSILPAIPLVW